MTICVIIFLLGLIMYLFNANNTKKQIYIETLRTIQITILAELPEEKQKEILKIISENVHMNLDKKIKLKLIC